MKYGMTLIPLLAAAPAAAHPGHIEASTGTGLVAGLLLIAAAGAIGLRERIALRVRK